MTPHGHRSRARRIALIAGLAVLAVAVVAPTSSAATAKTRRISVHSNGGQAHGTSSEPSTSANGRFTAFESDATDLVNNDGNGAVRDIFVHDRKTRRTTLVSRHTDGTPANGPSGDPAISADGRFVAFESAADNLVDIDGNGATVDVFVHDRKTKANTLVSVHSNGTAGDGPSSDPALSANGRYVSFESRATNLVNNDGLAFEDVLVHDRNTGKTTLVSRRPNGLPGNGDSENATLSADGRFVAFESRAGNLVKNDNNGAEDIFLYDRSSKKTILVSRRPNGASGNGDSADPFISANGRFVTFASVASKLVKNDTNGRADIFVFDRSTKKVERVSIRSNGRQGNDDSEQPTISANGRWVAFTSSARNLVAKDKNGAQDVFLRDRQTKKTIMLSRRPNGTPGDADSDDAMISGNGTWVTFESDGEKLVNNDDNGMQDIFLRGPLR